MSSTITVENAPTDPVELKAVCGRFNIRLLAAKLGIFDQENPAERDAFLVLPIEEQCNKVCDKLIEVRGGGKAKKGKKAAEAAAPPARTPVNKGKAAPPPTEEDEEDEEENEEEDEVDEADEEETDEEEDGDDAPTPPPAKSPAKAQVGRAPVSAATTGRTPTSAPATRAPVAAAAGKPAASGEQILGILQRLVTAVEGLAGSQKTLSETVLGMQDTIANTLQATNLSVGIALKTAMEVTRSSAEDLIGSALEDMASVGAMVDQYYEELNAAKPPKAPKKTPRAGK